MTVGPTSAQQVTRKKLSNAARRWVERTLKRMTVEEKVGQLLMVPYFGAFSNTESEEFARLARQVEKLHVGGLVVATRRRRPAGVELTGVYALARLTNRLQQRARTPLLVAGDFERGASFRVRRTTVFPHNMTVGAAGDPKLAEAMGRVAAEEAQALGVHWVLAPVADVNNNPENPVINIRSFGEDPEQVARLVAAYVRGCEEGGALCTAKHFPGHGDTATDSHLRLPVIAADRARLDSVELVPFRAAIAAGVSAVMPGHLVIPTLEPEAQLPATFSSAVLTDLLRRELGFDGLVITDAMTMNAITEDYWAGEAAVRAIEAGADVILMPPEPEVAFAALKRAAESGRISRGRLDVSVRRILEAKARLNLHRSAQVELSRLEANLAGLESERQALAMADRGVALLRDDAGILPIDSTRPQRGFLLVLSADASAYPGDAFERELTPRVDSLLTVRADPLYFTPEEVELPSPDSYDWSIVAVFVRAVSGRGDLRFPDELAALAERVLAAGKPTILLILGSPYLAEHFPAARTVLCTFSTAAAAERAAVRALFGQTAIGGKLPVTIPGVAARGDGLSRPAQPMELGLPTAESEIALAPVFSVLEEAVAGGVTPGGVLAVGHRGRLWAIKPFGRFTYAEDSARVQADTLYDLASLTKVVGTTTAAMLLYERGVLPLEAPITQFLPELAQGSNGNEKGHIQVRHLLTHSSGLPGYLRLYREVKNREELLQHIYALPLEYPTGARAVYSDLGIILLGEIIERLSGRPLDQFLRENLFAPLGMENTFFNPPEQRRARIAPTEEDREFRGRVVQGEVHDENAWVMGGVAPHAGLFSTARDVAVFSQLLLNGGIYAHRRILQRDTLELFTARQNLTDSTRALGWDTPSDPPAYSSAGQYFSSRAFGHTGFTGTSIWIDPGKDLFVVLLTNRVHPTRENNRIRALRPRVHNAVVKALGLAPATPGVPAVPGGLTLRAIE